MSHVKYMEYPKGGQRPTLRGAVEGRIPPRKGGVSGGTLASGIHAQVSGDAVKFSDPHVLDPGYESTARTSAPKAVRFFPFLGRWLAPSVMEAINQKVVYRTRGLLSREYGDLQYRESTAVSSRLSGHLMRLGLGVIGLVLKFSSVFLALGVIPKPSEGPSEEEREDEEEEVAPMRVTRARAGATAVLA